MELESVLLTCGFHEEDAEIILGEFLAGMVNVGEARGAPADQMMSEILTHEQMVEILTKALDDRLAALTESERATINFELLEHKFGYR